MTDKGGAGFNVWIGGSLAYHVLLTLALFAGAFHFNHRLGILERRNTVQCVNAAKKTPQQKVEGIKKSLNYVHKTPTSAEFDINNSNGSINSTDRFTPVKREVLSEKNLQIALRGPPGPPGRDGRDAPSLASIEKFINTSAALYVEKEWVKFQTSIPNYGGSLYVRWGRKTCPDTSNLIYGGIAAGSDFRSPAGGSNIQCLPSDPQYDPKYKDVKVLNSFLTKVVLDDHSKPDIFGSELYRAQLPCAVCEAKKRVSKFMFPAATKCPSSDWTLEYKGFLVSDYNMHAGGTIHMDGNRHSRSSYECMDEHPVSTHPGVASGFTEGGTLFRLTKTSCSGDTNINFCPPYDPYQPLSCVMCTK